MLYSKIQAYLVNKGIIKYLVIKFLYFLYNIDIFIIIEFSGY